MRIWGKSKGGNCPFMEKFMVSRGQGNWQSPFPVGELFCALAFQQMWVFFHIYMWRHFLCWMWFCHWFLLCLKQTKECIWWALRLITSLSLFLFVCLCCRAVCFGLSVSLIQNFGSRHTLSACFAIFLNRSRFCEFVPPSRLEGEAKEARTGGYYARGHYFCHRNHLRWNHLSLLAVIRILLLKWIHNT